MSRPLIKSRDRDAGLLAATRYAEKTKRALCFGSRSNAHGYVGLETVVIGCSHSRASRVIQRRKPRSMRLFFFFRCVIIKLRLALCFSGS